MLTIFGITGNRQGHDMVEHAATAIVVTDP